MSAHHDKAARNWAAVLSQSLVLAGCLCAGSAWAAGVEYPDNGTVAIGRGGAWAANPSDGLAFQYNPAGLAQQHGLNLTLDGRAAQQHLAFTSTSIPGSAKVENSAPPFFGPSACLSYGFGAVGPLSELTLALGATGPSSIGKLELPAQGAQRYAIQSTDYFIAYYSAAVAVGWSDWLRLGLTFQLAHGNATFTQAVYSGTAPGTDPKNDTTATFAGSNGIKPAFVLGATVLPTKTLAIGLSWRPRLDFAADGTLKTVGPDWAKTSSWQVGDTAQLQLKFADMVRLGAQWRPRPDWEVEVDAVYEAWSALKEVRIKTSNINVKTSFDTSKPVPDIVFPHVFQDTISLRLGGEHELLADRLRLRAGYMYETSAVPTKYVSVDFPNWARHVASVGASLHVYDAWIDLAYAHHFVATQTVTDSVIEQKETPAVLPGMDAPKAAVVGNGTYEAGMDIVSLALRVPFGAKASAKP
jgi:long-subunit fatty acid transport protein